MENAAPILDVVSKTNDIGLAHILIFSCFAYMVWQSYLQFKQKSRSEIQVEELSKRMDKQDDTVVRIFNRLDYISDSLLKLQPPNSK